MAISYVDVAQEQVTASNVDVYTAPTTSNFESAHIIYANCSNVTTSDVELTVHIVQSGGTAATTNIYFPTKVIFAGRYDPLTALVGRTLKAGDSISSVASAASSLNLSFSIKEIYAD